MATRKKEVLEAVPEVLPMPVSDCPHCRGTGKVLDAKAVGLRIKARMQDEGLSGNALAEAVNTSPISISKIVRGEKMMGSPTMMRVLEYLGMRRELQYIQPTNTDEENDT